MYQREQYKTLPASSEANLTSSEANLTSLVEPKQIKKKCTQQELFDIIVNCADEWKSLDEISREVNRSAQYLKGAIIHKMVEQELLQQEVKLIENTT